MGQSFVLYNSDSFLYTLAFDLILLGISVLLVFIVSSCLLRIDEFKAMVSLQRYRQATVSRLYREGR